MLIYLTSRRFIYVLKEHRNIKILSDPSRLEILDLLSCGELCACDLLEHFQFSQPTLSHHMKSLVDNELVIVQKTATNTCINLIILF